MEIRTMSFDVLISTGERECLLELLAIDVESLDADVILSVNSLRYSFRTIPFSAFHLGKDENAIHERLVRSGYLPVGMRVDIYGLDALEIGTDSAWMKMQARIWELERVAKLQFAWGDPWKVVLYLLNYWRTNRKKQHNWTYLRQYTLSNGVFVWF